MSGETFDLSKMTVEDLFLAKRKRRQRLTKLPFEEKIEIVKKLQSISRAARTDLGEDGRKQVKESGRLKD